MSGLIKAAAASAGICGFTAAPRQERIPQPQPASPLAVALDEARAESAVLRDALHAARDEAREIEATAFEAGRRAGKTDAEDGALEHETLVRDALIAARGAWDERLDALDTLAAMLTRAALAKMFADYDDLANLVGRAVAHRLAMLRRESIVAIRVSGADFADPATLSALAERTGTAITVDPLLDPGACRFDLQLGHVDIGIGDQARRLDALLAACGEEAA